MNRAVSRVDALVEMVNAYDEQQLGKSNRIGQILCKSIQMDNQKNTYTSYINLGKKDKRLFPIKIRKSIDEITVDSDPVIIKVKVKK